MRWLCVLMMVLAGLRAPVWASETLDPVDRTYQCATRASKVTGLPVLLIWAVKRVESGGALVGKVQNENDNGSVDRGLMQINSIWEPWVAKFGVAPEQLHDPCVSLLLGSVILANEVRAHGLVEGIGRYHIGNPEGRKTPALRRWARERHTWYVLRVTEELKALQAGLLALKARSEASNG